MKILLLQDVKDIGRKMEVREVSDGYARNFLIPKKFAIQHDEKAAKEKLAWDELHAKQSEKRAELAHELAEKIFMFQVKTGSKGEIYESVTKEKIEAMLSKMGFLHASVYLAKPLKQLGEHEVEVRFGEGVITKTKILIEPEQS